MEKIKTKTIATAIFTALILSLSITSILFLPACNKNGAASAEAAEEESKYIEATVEKRDMASKITLIGRALTETTDSLFFEISGELLFIVDEGNIVLEGEKLAELDDKILVEELEELQSSIEDARDLYEHELLKHHYTYENIEIEIELAEYNYYHESEGRKLDQLTFKQQLLILEEQKAQADFDLSQKEDELNDLQEEYEDRSEQFTDELEIVAPYDCLITSVSAREGYEVDANQEIIEIIDFNSIVIRADLPEVDKNKIKEDMEVNIYFDAYPDNIVKGNIFRIGQIPITTGAGTFYEIFIEFTDLQGLEIANIYGLNAEIEIIISGGENILVVPIDYVYSEGDENYVYKITGDETIEKTYVEIGISDFSYIEIISGLNEDDRILIIK
ncbi:hypothetical protein ES705_00227 [subsurface metagenome]|nr:HlyD family efflux transporter periplasmic adaptor subunit [Clostridia bacterium]